MTVERSFLDTSVGRIANFILFQLGWFACVLGGAYDRSWAGPALVLSVTAVYLAISKRRARDFNLVLISALLGFVFDSSLVHFGVFEPKNSAFPAGFTSHWLVAMWVNFAITLPYSMSWLRGRYVLGATLGAISGPIAYLAGARLGAITILTDSVTFLVLLAIAWAIVIPVLLRLGTPVEENP